MLMNSIEYWTVNNPVRGLIQRRLEAPRLKVLCDGRADKVLEIGCGQGVGAAIIHDLYGPDEYVGIDLDPKMLKRARRKKHGLKNAVFLEGDAANLPLTDGTFDLAVDFGIIHHIPNWRDALSELHRVLKTNGAVFFEELPVETWERGIGKPLKKLLQHPYEEMFRQQEFLDELQSLGFAVESYEETLFGFYYFWGCAVKTP